MHNFKYTLKTLFKNKVLIFWTFAFPIILGTLFNMAFSNIEKSEKLDIIPIAIVRTKQFDDNKIFKETFKTLSDKNNKERIFSIQYVTEVEAKKLLDDDKIKGYLLVEDTKKIMVNTSGIYQTILKHIVEEISQVEEMIQSGIATKMKDSNIDFSILYGEIKSMLSNSNANIKNISSNHLSYTMIEFYTLIAMTCLYSGILAMVAVNQNLANMSHTGKRISVSPTSKAKIIFTSILASYLVQLIGIILLFTYTIFILKVDYGDHFLFIIPFVLVSLLAGLSLGVMLAVLLKTNDSVKLGILLSITMLGCFLSGMMGITMKYIIDKNIPIINKLNLANMITDGLYSLYYYNSFDRFYMNLFSLLIFSFIMISLSIIGLRRQKYDCI